MWGRAKEQIERLDGVMRRVEELEDEAQKQKARELAPDHAAVVTKLREYTKRLAALEKPGKPGKPIVFEVGAQMKLERAALRVFGDIQALSDAARLVVYAKAAREAEQEQAHEQQMADFRKRMQEF